MGNFALSTLDIAIILSTILFSVAVGIWASRRVEQTSRGFFLASGQMPWWLIGAAFVSTSVSSEQIVGTIGAAYKYGMGIANWEWWCLPTYALVMIFFIPLYLKNRISTVPELLERRFRTGLRAFLQLRHSLRLCLPVPGSGPLRRQRDLQQTNCVAARRRLGRDRPAGGTLYHSRRAQFRHVDRRSPMRHARDRRGRALLRRFAPYSRGMGCHGPGVTGAVSSLPSGQRSRSPILGSDQCDVWRVPFLSIHQSSHDPARPRRAQHLGRPHGHPLRRFHQLAPSLGYLPARAGGLPLD